MNANDIKVLIESRMECVRVRDHVHEFFKEYAGKTWTRVYRDKLAVRLAVDIPGVRADDLIQREDEFTGIEVMTRDYLNSGGRKGFRFTVAKGGWQKDPDKIMCPVKVAEWNPAHFRGIDERNASRRAILANPDAIALLARCIEGYKLTRAALVESREPFEPDWYEILEKAEVKL